MALLFTFLSVGEKFTKWITTALAGGELASTGEGRVGVADAVDGYGANAWATLIMEGVYRVPKASGVTLAINQRVYLDASAATQTAIALPEDAGDLYIGTAIKAAASGDDYVDVLLENSKFGGGRGGVFASFPVLLDHSDSADHTIVRAEDNPNGLVITAKLARITEQPAGDTEDQLVFALDDEDDNELETITTTDGGGAEDVNEVVGGVAGKYVPAGKAVTARVKQATSGSGAAGAAWVFGTFIKL